MRRIAILVCVLLLITIPLLAFQVQGAHNADFSVTPWGIDPPSGDWADYDITYSMPTPNPDGLTWCVSDIRHVPVGENGTDPGNHNVYVYTYNWEGWPNDPNAGQEWALHVPERHVKIAYWCSGEEKPSPANSHWIVQETWPGSATIPADEPGTNFVISRGNICRVAVWNPAHPEYSAIVSNIHAMHADEGEGVRNGHHSFKISFTALDTSEQMHTPTPEPTATPTIVPTWTPETVTEQDIREAAWNAVGVDWNPDAAFGVYARAHGLGVPMGNEFDLGEFRIQPFMLGIVYAKIGDWQNVRALAW